MGQAVIVYTDSSDHWTARFIHPQVNHCLLCVAYRGQWIVYDWCSDGLNAYAVDKLPIGVYYQLVELDSMSLWPFLPTCVGFVKHAIGVKNPFVQTPWQLLRYVENGRKSKEAKENQPRSCYATAAINGARSADSRERAQVQGIGTKQVRRQFFASRPRANDRNRFNSSAKKCLRHC